MDVAVFQLFALHSLLSGGRDLTFPLYKDKKKCEISIFFLCNVWVFRVGSSVLIKNQSSNQQNLIILFLKELHNSGVLLSMGC